MDSQPSNLEGLAKGEEADSFLLERLRKIACSIDSHDDWWRFPEDPPVRGFFGTARLFFVGDQPSTSQWSPTHQNRRAFYGLLTKLGITNAHLTDLYKRRGPASTLKYGMPSDFPEHLALFRDEMEIIRPTRIIALGKDAYDLLWINLPEIRLRLHQIWHFAYAVRYGRISQWERQLKAVLEEPTVPLSDTPSLSAMPVRTETRQPSFSAIGRPRTQRAVMRQIYAACRHDPERVILEYAAAERRGEVSRSSNSTAMRAEDYARALLNDGLKKGWL